MTWTRNLPTLTADGAQRAIAAGFAQATADDVNVSIAVLDPAARLLAFARMDGAPHISIATSIKKAQTAVGFGVPTGQAWLDIAAGDPILEGGIAHLPDFILLGGGVPIYVDGQVVGAVGVSGGHYAQDARVAAAALKALEP